MCGNKTWEEIRCPLDPSRPPSNKNRKAFRKIILIVWISLKDSGFVEVSNFIILAGSYYPENMEYPKQCSKFPHFIILIGGNLSL